MCVCACPVKSPFFFLFLFSFLLNIYHKETIKPSIERDTRRGDSLCEESSVVSIISNCDSNKQIKNGAA